MRWSHERCGTVEPAHDMLKNELGGGVPTGYRFGANAAWWQLVVLTANLLAVLKRIALPLEWAALRPRRLRFLLLQRAGRLFVHGRRLILRLARDHPGTAAFVAARQRLQPATWAVLSQAPGTQRARTVSRSFARAGSNLRRDVRYAPESLRPARPRPTPRSPPKRTQDHPPVGGSHPY